MGQNTSFLIQCVVVRPICCHSFFCRQLMFLCLGNFLVYARRCPRSFPIPLSSHFSLPFAAVNGSMWRKLDKTSVNYKRRKQIKWTFTGVCVLEPQQGWLHFHLREPTSHSICGSFIIYRPSPTTERFMIECDESLRAGISCLPCFEFSVFLHWAHCFE